LDEENGVEFDEAHGLCPKWFPVFLSGIGLASLALSNLFW
jgi:hypothetical protein